MKVRVITDSTADMPIHIQQQVRVVPLTLSFGDEEYIDGVTITRRGFYEKLIECDVMPTTSQASPEAFREEFRKAADAGETVVAVTISSALSGTWQSAMIAAQDFPGKVFVVDSRNVSIGTGVLVQRAVEMASQGLGAQEIAENLTAERQDLRIMALFDTLEYLKKGGRISGIAAVAGGLLSIKPVATLNEQGEITILGKARGSRQGNNFLIRQIQEGGGVDFTRPLLMGYTGLDDSVLKKYIEDSACIWEGCADTLPTAMIGSVVGTHAGPGAIAAAYFVKK